MTNETKAFAVNERVRVSESFWIPRYRGQVGTVYSETFAADGQPTCYVRFGPEGQWILVADLMAVGGDQ